MKGEKTMIIDGKALAAAVLGRLASQPAPRRFLAAFLVGDDASSRSFLRQKGKAAKEAGVDFRLYEFPETIPLASFQDEIRKVVCDSMCGGVLIQLPLPAHLDRHAVLDLIPLEKDVDVLGRDATGAFYAEQGRILPPAVSTIEEIIRVQNFDLRTATVAVVGLGFLVGKPVSLWIERRAGTTLLLHRGSDFSLLKRADLIIAGVGKAGVIASSLLKPGAAVIDFGYDGGKGDFAPSSDASIAFYTPTPGGTGPLLVAKLLENFYRLNA